MTIMNGKLKSLVKKSIESGIPLSELANKKKKNERKNDPTHGGYRGVRNTLVDKKKESWLK